MSESVETPKFLMSRREAMEVMHRPSRATAPVVGRLADSYLDLLDYIDDLGRRALTTKESPDGT